MRRAGVVLVVLVMLAGCGPSPAKPPSARVERAPPPAPRSAEAPPSAPEEPSPDEPLPPYAPRPIVPAPPSVPTPRPTPPPTPRPTPTRAEEKACAARGGKIEPVCLGGELECVLRYRDAGKRCTDTKDCVGECLYEGAKPVPAKPVGACQRTSDPCGCKAPIVNGKVEDAFCVD